MKYTVPFEEFDEAHNVPGLEPHHDASDAAELAAEDFHANRDGYEWHWPLEFRIWSDAGEVLGRFSVERDFNPQFSAARVK